MEELFTLKELLFKGDVSGAIALVEDLEEMGHKGIFNNIRSYGVVLLLHLIKQQVESRTTRSWDVSIRNAVFEIRGLNERPKSRGNYLSEDEIRTALEKAYPQAISRAALEIRGGQYEDRELAAIVNRAEIIDRALALILDMDDFDV